MESEQLAKTITMCRRCSLRGNCKTPTPFEGHTDATLMLVLEHPGQLDGVHRKFLNKLLRSAGIAGDDVWLTFQFKCPLTKRPTVSQRDTCKQWLWKEIVLSKPRVIVTAGLGPSVLLHRDKSLKLDDVVGKFITHDYLPGGGATVAAVRSIDVTLKGPMELVYETIDILRKARDFACGTTPP